jgi:hypothetical protein
VSVRGVGVFGVRPAGTLLHVIGGGVSPGLLGEFAQAQKQAGFDLVLVVASGRPRNRSTTAAASTKFATSSAQRAPGAASIS